MHTLGSMNKKIPMKLFYGAVLSAMAARSGMWGFLVKSCEIVLLQVRTFLMLMLVEVILSNSCSDDPEAPKHSLILEDTVPFILS